MKLSYLLALAVILSSNSVKAQTVDYSVPSVPEETGIDFVKVSRPGDYVAMPEVRRNGMRIAWFTNSVLDMSPDGETLAFLSARNNTTNIFVKDVLRQSGSVQRTNRGNVMEFSYSPNGKEIVFAEKRGKETQIFTTPATTSYVCRQITSGNVDCSPVYSNDMSKIFFCRSERKGSSIWSYDIKNNFLSNYASGMNPAPALGNDYIFVSRVNTDGRSEIWKIDYAAGTEECIVSNPSHNFTNPRLSPDGQWLLLVGDGHINIDKVRTYDNTDIFVCRPDGTQLTQLTFHASDDISPIWSTDGKSIYFVSRRGDASGEPNIWRMNFPLLGQ